MSTVKKPETKVEAKAADKVEAVKVTAKKAEAPKAEAVKKAEAPKAAVKKVEAPKAEAVKKAEAPKTAVKKAEAPKAAVKKAEAPKVAAKKAEPAKKTAAKKAPAKKAEKATEEVYIEFNSAKVSTADIVAKVVEATGKKASSIKVLNVYIQPETGKTYYTADGVSGEIEYLFQ
ncbi:uncharacterized protein BN743_00581 [Clostridium sp. CAG:632]|nr:uncharacterized protein BN743_00581 [Clostridium sp. CAG:632]